MKKYIIVGVAVALVIAATVLTINKQCSRQPYQENNIEQIQTQIDSIYIVRDSIINRIDTVYKQIDDVNKEYEKEVDRINSNTPNEDLIFFSDYINSNRARLDSINNSR